MIGIFDSGSGGLCALAEIRRMIPSADILFLADRENAPYGTKTKKELLRLVKADISLLCERGADAVLMACCTASTVYPQLPRQMQNISLPIIAPAAREAAALTRSGRIGVIATEYTAASSCFKRELSRFKNVKYVDEQPMQKLVLAVEAGLCDRRISNSERSWLFRLLEPIRKSNIDTLILGCTHFSHLEVAIGCCLPNVRIVSPAREGAKEIIKDLDPIGKGQTIYL